MRSILSELLRQERLVVVDSLSVDEPKTKLLVNMLKDFVDSKVTIITDEIDTNLGLASRNLYKINVVEATKVDPLSLVGADKVIVTLPAMKRLEEVLA
jgi:large subunit ribosomal protein L4